jgi:hypothetical protein
MEKTTMSSASVWILLAHAGTTLAMVGLIWFVQIVHYPLFARVGPAEFTAYEVDHQRLTTKVVAPLMLVEFSTAAALVWLRPPGIDGWLVWTGIVLVSAVWLLTWKLQVPQHAKLATRYDSTVQRQLVQGNWYRTVAWSVRGLIVLAMIGQSLTRNAAT